MLDKLLKIAKIVLAIACGLLVIVASAIIIEAQIPRDIEYEVRHRGTLDFSYTLPPKETPSMMKVLPPASDVFNEYVHERKTEEEPKWISVMATAYTSAEEENGGFGAHDCKYGFDLVDGEHIASDLSFLPYGTKVYIEGLGERTVVDTASKKTLNNVNEMARERGCEGWIDIYMGDRTQDMDDWGIQVVRLYVIEER